MTKSFALLFQMKRSKALPNGNAPIYLRITIDSERVEIATKRNAPPDKWNTIAQKVMGNTDEAKSVNNQLKTVEQKAYEVYREMIERKIPITAQSFKDRMNGIEEGALLVTFTDMNTKISKIIVMELMPGDKKKATWRIDPIYPQGITHEKNGIPTGDEWVMDNCIG